MDDWQKTLDSAHKKLEKIPTTGEMFAIVFGCTVGLPLLVIVFLLWWKS